MRFSLCPFLGLFLGLFPGMALPVSAVAQESPACTEKGTNGMVTMLLCPEGLDEADLAAEGRAVCGARKPCGAWIWTDAAMIPANAPDSHDKLPKEAVRNAVAIWVNEAEQLISVTQDKAE